MIEQIGCLASLVTRAASQPWARPQWRRRSSETGLEVLQVVILAAAFAALAILAAAIIKVKVLDTANSIQTQ